MQSFICKGQSLILHPSRTVFWEEESALILSDLHFGKSGHFRKSGIAIPQNVYKEDLQRLVSTIQYFQPRQLIIAGDLFHSRENKELDWFTRWRADLSWLNIHLIKGNHDILRSKWYEENSISVSDCEWKIGDFLFAHDPADCKPDQAETSYMFTGHIHPGVGISGPGRQFLQFPCFYFTETYCILPAFSRFTGTHRIRPKEHEQVFAIVNDEIIQMR
jgi:DNA ligase-associated metallophosphoesterase